MTGQFLSKYKITCLSHFATNFILSGRNLATYKPDKSTKTITSVTVFLIPDDTQYYPWSA